jgi:predicted aspartyl protease
MMQLTLKDDLPFTRLTVAYHGITLTIDNVLIDTGSASTVLAARAVAQIGILPEMTDNVYTVRGIGGTEAVFTRRIDQIAIEEQTVTDFEIEVGGLSYGFEIDGILGMDFLTKAGAIINLRDFNLDFAN